MPRSSEITTPRNPNKLTESVRLRRLLAPALLSASLLGATAGSAQTPRAERYVAPNAKSAQTPDSTYTDQAPKFDDVLSDIHNQLAQQAQPLEPGLVVTYRARKDALSFFDDFNYKTEEITKLSSRQKVGSRVVSLALNYNDSLITNQYGEVSSREWFDGGWYEEGKRSLPSTLVSPDIIFAKKVRVRAYTRSGQRLQPISQSQQLQFPNNFGYTSEVNVQNGAVEVAGSTFVKNDDPFESTFLSRKVQPVRLILAKALNAKQLSKGVYFKVTQSWRTRYADYGKDKGSLTQIYGPFKKTKATKSSPKSSSLK